MTVVASAPPAAVTRSATRPTSGPTTGGRPAHRRLSTPAGLQLLLALLAVLCVLCGTLGAVVAARSAGAAHQLTQTTVPAEVDAATVYTSIADADATAATAFLAGGLEPPALRSAYEGDIARAGTALASIGAPGNDRAARALADISGQLPVYTGLIETARANNRQGFPVGGAYLSSASDIAQTRLLTDADTLLLYEQSRVSAGYADARSSGTTALLFLVLIALGAVLIVGQLALTRRTRRVVNLPLTLATLLVLGTLIGASSVVAVARDRLDTASSEGSSQIALLTAAQTDALQEKGDESLTLVGRGDDSHEPQFAKAAGDLAGQQGLLDRAVDAASTTSDEGLLADAAREQQVYVVDHAKVTAATAAGDFAGSDAAQAAGAIPFAGLVSDLQQVSSDDQRIFTAKVSSTTGPLDALAVVVPVLCALALLAGAVGIRLRLREFR